MPATGEYHEIVVVCSSPDCGDTLASRMQSARRTHFGLYPGFLGNLAGTRAAIMVVDTGEEPAYAGLKQLEYLFHPKLAAEFGFATALVENLHAGDVAIVSECLRCYSPIAVTDGMEKDDALVFPSEEVRKRVLDARAISCNEQMLSKAVAAANGVLPLKSLQSEIPAVRVGTFDNPLDGQGTRGFARTRYRIAAADGSAYGFLLAAAESTIPAVSIKIMEDELGNDGRNEIRRMKFRFLEAGAEILERVLNA